MYFSSNYNFSNMFAYYHYALCYVCIVIYCMCMGEYVCLYVCMYVCAYV